MPTYQVTCQQCGEDKWPVLQERPSFFVCKLCLERVAAKRKQAE